MNIRYVIISLSASLANQFQAAPCIIRNINSHMNLVFSTNGEYRFGYRMLTAVLKSRDRNSHEHLQNEWGGA